MYIMLPTIFPLIPNIQGDSEGTVQTAGTNNTRKNKLKSSISS